MPKRISCFLAAILFLAWLSPAAADAGDLAGTWMHVGDRYGLVGSYVEQVDISEDGRIRVRLFMPPVSDVECDQGATGGACDIPRETVRGKLKADPNLALLVVTDRDEITPAFPSPPYHSFNQEVWEAIRFAGLMPWIYELEGDILRLSRSPWMLRGSTGLEKVYHRVDPGMAADLYDFLIIMNLPILMAGCAIDAIQSDAAMRAEFRRIIADIAPATRGGDMAAAQMLRQWLMASPHATRALFPGAEPALPRIKACIDEFT